MCLPTLCAALIAASAFIPGADVDSAVDDRQMFQKLEAATTELAVKGESSVKRAVRLEQCKRTSTDAIRLSARTGAAGSPLDGAEAYRRAARASVLIGSAYKCDKCTKWHHTLATGFAVSADGVIATNHHVAANAAGEAMGVLTADGRFFPVVEVLAADKPHDVALLRVEAQDLAFLTLRDDAPAGSPIRCYSHPANSFGFISEGLISRYFHMNEPERKGAVFMQVTADYARGSSGGPVMDAFGDVVGMVASTLPVFAATPDPHGSAKEGKEVKPTTPSQQMVRRNCATARAILELTRAR